MYSIHMAKKFVKYSGGDETQLRLGVRRSLCLHGASARFSAIGSALGGFDGAFATFHTVAFGGGLLTAKGTAGA